MKKNIESAIDHAIKLESSFKRWNVSLERKKVLKTHFN